MEVEKKNIVRMDEKQVSLLSFDCTTGFSFTKSTLPAKLIQLRRESQEKHVRRIKLAYKKKEMLGLMDISSCLSTSFPRKKFLNKSKSSPDLTTKDESCAADIQARRKEKFDLLPAKANSDFLRKNTYTGSSKCSNKNKTGEIKKKRNTCLSNKTRLPSEFSKSDVSSCIANKNTPMVERVDYLDIETENEKSVIFSKDDDVSCCNGKGDGKDNELFFKKSPIAVNEPKNIYSGVKKKPSKIPILKTRVFTKDSPKQNYCSRLENARKAHGESLKYLFKNVTEHMNNLTLPPVTENQDNNWDTQNPFILSNIDLELSAGNSYKERYPSYCEENMSFADKWMNVWHDNVDDGGNFSDSLLCKFKAMTLTSPERESNPFIYLTGNDIYQRQGSFKDSKVSRKFEYVTGSEDSLESEYGIEETDDDEQNKPKSDGTNKWQDINLEAESTITVPSDNDLEIADHRDPVYRNLPDYPNTPYNLRYPRYKFNRDNNGHSSVNIKSVDNENKAKTPKDRKKTSNITPKRIVSGKRRKLKKQIFRKKDF